MQSYPQRVRDNILPLSVGSTLPEAFEEWLFTDEVIDHNHANEVCELCEQDDLRYHFRIKNQLTHHHLWVGSHCILRFNVSVFEQGRRLSPEEAKRRLNRLEEQMRMESCINALERVAATENNDILKNALTYLRKNKNLTPKYAFVVLWRLKINKIDHNPGFFKVTLKTAKQRTDLLSMDKIRVHLIWPALTSTQRDIAIRLGHTPPGL